MKEERGAALVEFALVLPLLLLVLLGMIDFGQAFTMWSDETHLANSAARSAAVNSWTDSSGTKQTVDSSVGTFETAIGDDADTQELQDTIDVNVCLPPGSDGKIGSSIRVDVTGSHEFLEFLSGFVAPLAGDLTVDLTAHSVMRIEKDYADAFIADAANHC